MNQDQKNKHQLRDLEKENMKRNTIKTKAKNLLNRHGIERLGKDWRTKLIKVSGSVGIFLLLGLGVFGQMGWLPTTNPETGKRTGWFGSEVSRNSESSNWNPFAETEPQTNLQLSKEYIYAGSRLLAIEEAGGGGGSGTPTPTPTPPPSGDINFALASNGGVATASTTLSNYSTAATINGDRKGLNWGTTDGGWADSTGNVFPDWLQVDFDGQKSINTINVFTLQNSFQSPSEPTLEMEFTVHGIKDYTVQYWDGSAWVDIETLTNNNKVWKQFTFPSVTTDKIRVFVDLGGSGYSRITEVEALGDSTPPPANINHALAANGGVATASSTHASYSTAATINGDRKGLNWGTTDSGWVDGQGNVFPDWLQIDFNGQKTINTINVFTLQNSFQSPSEPTLEMEFTIHGIKDYTVQYWNGSAWVDIETVINNNKVWKQFTFPSVTTDKIRVFVDLGGSGYSRITEIEAF